MSDTITVPPEWQCLSSSRIPEVKVWITMDGKPVATHKKDTMNQASVHFYDGRTKLTKPFVHHLHLDGIWVQGYYAKKDDTMYTTPLDSPCRLTTYSPTTAPGYEQPLVFGKVATTDDPSKAKSSERAISRIGTIKIEYRRIKGVKMVPVPPSPPRLRTSSSSTVAATSTESNPQTLIDEKKKKAQFGLSTGLGQARPVGQSVSVGGSHSSASQDPVPPKPAPKPTKKVEYKIVDADTPFITYTFRVRSSIGIQDELFADEPIAGGSGSSKRSSASLEDEDDEEEDLDEEALEAKLKALEEKAARLRAKRAKTSKPDVKPEVTPPPPFDWEERPPIFLEKRWYVDYEVDEAEEEEAQEVEKEKLEMEKREENVVEL
ncbi:hypothetical protein JCM5350_003707 [Sporobolomyces pararoseus]